VTDIRLTGHDHWPMIDRRLKPWIYGCNHSYIGMQYLISGTIGGSLGTAVSQLMRLELSMPG